MAWSDDLVEFYLKNGGMWTFFLTHMSFIGQFISENKMPALGTNDFPVQVGMPAVYLSPNVDASKNTEKIINVRYPPHPHGGIKVPHLHYRERYI